MSVLLCLIACLVVVTVVSYRAPTEGERVEEWHAAGNTWPPQWQDETVIMKENMRLREEEIMRLEGGDERWENWLQFTQSRLVPKFTPMGFEVIPTPKDMHEKLAKAMHTAIDSRWDNLRSEGDIDVILNDSQYDPKFIDIGPLAKQVLGELREYHEEWANGMKLQGTSAYGIRLYQNGSTLVMHYDRVETHVISSIVHIGHEYDDNDEPWPIQIEDHDGVLHSVNLEAGQMLFYESAKCLHGRMTTFKGKYYGSIFLHYQPVDKSIWNFHHDDVIAHVPPQWKNGIKMDRGDRFTGASLSIDSRVTENIGLRAVPKVHDEL